MNKQSEIELNIQKIKLEIKSKELEISRLNIELIKEEQKLWKAIAKKELVLLLQEKFIFSKRNSLSVMTELDFKRMTTNYATYVYIESDSLCIGGYICAIDGDKFSGNDRFTGDKHVYIRKDLKKYS